MKKIVVKDMWTGIVLALVAAYFYPAVLLFFFLEPRAFFIIFSPYPFIGLLYSFWLVIPMGAALGLLIPRIAYGKSLWRASLHAAAFGALGGLVAALCFVSLYEIRIKSLIVASTVAYCALWTGAYAYIRAKRQNIYR